jgi:hypothetical protein
MINFMGILDSMKMLYKTFLLTYSWLSLSLSITDALPHYIPIFFQDQMNAEHMISS